MTIDNSHEQTAPRQLWPSPVWCLLLAMACQLAATPRWWIPEASWVATFFLLLYSRRIERVRWLWATWLILWPTSLIANWGVIPVPRPIFVVMMAIFSLIGLLPYLLDRWVFRRLQFWGRSLLFPSLMTGMEMLSAQGDHGIWGSEANQHVRILPLMQWVAWTGPWSITFFVTASASFVADAWLSRQSSPQRSRRRLSGVGLATAVFLIAGGIRMVTIGAPSKVTPIAGVIVATNSMFRSLAEDYFDEPIDLPDDIDQADPRLARLVDALVEFQADPSPEKFPRTWEEIRRVEDQLFEYSAAAADHGAKIVSWTEAAVATTPDDEQRLLKRASEFAAQHEIYLLITSAVMIPGRYAPGEPNMENQAILFAPSGEQLLEFWKNKPVPGAETSFPGDGSVPVVETPFGRIAVSICYDADFPHLMQQLGQQDAHVLLLPAGDWKQIAPYHSYMAAVRGIENGTAVVRPVRNGTSLVTDARGVVIHAYDHFAQHDGWFVADVPIYDLDPLYPRVGDSWLFWTSWGLSGLLCVLGIRSYWGEGHSEASV